MKVMVCFDGSDPSRAALKEAKRYAREFKTETVVVTSEVTADRFRKKEIEEAKRLLEEVRADFEKEGFACETHLSARGLAPGEDLNKFAEENNVDQIMVGIKRRSQLEKLIVGSVAQYLLLKSRCPVLGVK